MLLRSCAGGIGRLFQFFKIFRRKQYKTSITEKTAIPVSALAAQERTILKILDESAEDLKIPMLDNGYVYLAASRLTIFRAQKDWAFVFETFGYSPRAGNPDLTIQTIATSLVNRKTQSDYINREAYDRYLWSNKHSEYKTFFPIENIEWMNDDDSETLSPNGKVVLRGKAYSLPKLSEYAQYRIKLLEDEPMTFEACRFFAAKYRDKILATQQERRFNIPHHFEEFLSLDDWIHPNLADGQMPSETQSFRQLAKILVTGDTSQYTLEKQGNTHWKNWPEAGLL